MGLLLVLGAIVGFLYLRSNPSMLSKLPPQVRTAFRSVRLPTSLPDIQLPAGIPDIQLPTGIPGIQWPAGGSGNYGVQTKTSGCQASNGLPDSACTPGAIMSNVTVEQICTPGYAESARNVSEAEKNEVYAEYGITSHASGQYEVDHLISLELGGSNDVANLWPEAAVPTPGFHEKDQVENYLHDQVCSGQISLAQAQQEIATNWLAVYDQMPK